MKKNIGKFIIELRKKKKLSQYELANLIPIGREAVSKWERGVNIPSNNSLIRLSEILETTPEEILAGKKFSNLKKESREFLLKIYNEKNKLKKIIKIISSFTVLLLVFLIIYIFLNTYNSIKIYKISSDDSSITIKNGILVLTKDKIYFNLGNIECEEKIDKIKLYYKNKEEKLIYYTDDDKINLYDYYGYNGYFNYDNIKDIKNNLYVDINSKYTLKLELKKDFTNNYKYFFNKKVDKEISDNYGLVYNPIIDIDKIKEKFKNDNGIYTYKDKNYNFTLIEEHNLLNLSYVKEGITKEWIYYLDDGYLEFNKYQNNELINSFNFISENVTCNIDNCDKNEKEIEEFYQELECVL